MQVNKMLNISISELFNKFKQEKRIARKKARWTISGPKGLGAINIASINHFSGSEK